MKPKALLQN